MYINGHKKVNKYTMENNKPSEWEYIQRPSIMDSVIDSVSLIKEQNQCICGKKINPNLKYEYVHNTKTDEIRMICHYCKLNFCYFCGKEWRQFCDDSEYNEPTICSNCHYYWQFYRPELYKVNIDESSDYQQEEIYHNAPLLSELINTEKAIAKVMNQQKL